MKIQELMDGIHKSDIVLPEFQREYVWSRDQAKKLISSLIKEYPVGSLLFWKTDKPPELKNVKNNIEHFGMIQIILDGQQRLTTLYLLIRGEIPPFYKKEDIKTDPRDLCFNIDSGEFQYYQTNIMSKDPLWVKVIDCFNPNKKINVFELVKFLPDEEKLDAAQKYTDNLTKIKNIKEKDLPMQVVPSSADLRDAIDIFDLVNSQGTKLTDAELALTHVVGKWPEARRIIKRKIEELSTQNFNFNLSFMTRALVTVVSHRALYETIHDEPKEKLVSGWNKLSKILDYLVSILPDRAYIHSTSDLNTTNLLIPIVAFLSSHNSKFPNEQHLKRAIHFIYIASTWARYSGQTDQRLEYDVSLVFRENNPWDKLKDALIDQRGRIDVKPNDLEGRTAGHPLYLISYILAKSQGAVDWFNGMSLSAKKAGPYYVHSHHIFPTSVLYKNGYDLENHLHRKIVNEIANRAFLTADSNIVLSNQLPEEYLPIIEEQYPGALAKQFIPMQPELWKVERYSDFLEARRNLLAMKINEYFNSLVSKPIKVKEKSIKEIIEYGESAILEFKSTFQWDIVKKEKNKALRKSVLKTVAAFLNTDGGTLVIGVEDNGHVCGLQHDFKLVENSGDKFLNLLNSLIVDNIGAEYAGLIKTRFEAVNGDQVCIVDIDRGLIPAFLEIEGKKEFYVRMNNTSRSLDPEETVKYITQNWG
jgi:hypothetical protein